MIYLSELAHPLLKKYLEEQDEIHVVKTTDFVYEEISSHPDIYYCDLGSLFFKGSPSSLGYKYPRNVIYNAACTGKYFIHNTKYTAPSLLRIAEEMNMNIIHVNQGYTKCNTVIVGESSVIISDEKMASILGEAGLNVLLIEAGHIKLRGFDYGFIGGTCGKIKKEIVFNGNLEAHPNFEGIVNFIEHHNLKVKYFSNYPLTDIGSILHDIGE